ncbi:MAG: zinc ribbon domain-containing protein [Firmicutes bacterium]|nr:zinc ribbon domain-containing protein [Bacillota bacterium]
MAHCASCGSQLVEGAKFCSDCGAAQTAAADSQGAFAKGQTQAITEAFMKKKPIFKRWWFWVLAVIGVPLLLLVLVTAAKDSPGGKPVSAGTTQAAGIAMPCGSAAFAGEQYQTVAARLRAAGFKNVSAEELCDVLTGAQDEDGLTDSVSVGGSTDYDAESVFPKDAEIIVFYHSMPAVPCSATDFPLEDYPSAVTKLKGAGFNNIKLEGLGDLITGWLHSEGDVKAVTVNGSVAFVTGDRFPKDVPIVITFHSYKKSAEYAIRPETPEPGDIALPASALNFISKDYRTVAADLKKAGFTNIKTVKREDLITGQFYSDGEVAKITVNGVSDFYADKWFPADAKIILTYHTFIPDAATVPATTKAAAAATTTTAAAKTTTATTTTKTTASAPKDAVISVKNNTDFAEIMALKENHEPKILSFAVNNVGKTIEFDGVVYATAEMIGAPVRNEMLLVGNKNTYSPMFKLEEVAKGSVLRSAGEGAKFHIVARIVESKTTTTKKYRDFLNNTGMWGGLIFLEIISVKAA